MCGMLAELVTYARYRAQWSTHWVCAYKRGENRRGSPPRMTPVATTYLIKSTPSDVQLHTITHSDSDMIPVEATGQYGLQTPGPSTRKRREDGNS